MGGQREVVLPLVPVLAPLAPPLAPVMPDPPAVEPLLAAPPLRPDVAPRLLLDRRAFDACLPPLAWEPVELRVPPDEAPD